jgi:hypothetical protein
MAAARARVLIAAFATLALLGIAGIALAQTSPGRAAPIRLHVSVSRHLLAYRGRPATVSVRLQTGSSAETVAIEPVVSVWPDPAVIGSPLRVGSAHVSGPGRITDQFVSSCCAVPPLVCLRGGPPPDGSGVDLALPADTTTTLTYRVKLAAPPWRSSALSISIMATLPAVSNDPVRLRRYRLGAARFTVTGRTGVRITLALRGGLHRTPIPGQPVAVAGGALTVVGHTSPRLRRQRITITYDRLPLRFQLPPAASHGDIGTVTTGDHGAFEISWRPPRSGLYRIDASYPRPAPGLLADRSCDLAVAVR